MATKHGNWKFPAYGWFSFLKMTIIYHLKRTSQPRIHYCIIWRLAESGWWLAPSAGFPAAGSASGVSLNLYFGWWTIRHLVGQNLQNHPKPGSFGFQDCFWMAMTMGIIFGETCLLWLGFYPISEQIPAAPRLKRRPKESTKMPRSGQQPPKLRGTGPQRSPGSSSRSLATTGACGKMSKCENVIKCMFLLISRNQSGVVTMGDLNGCYWPRVLWCCALSLLHIVTFPKTSAFGLEPRWIPWSWMETHFGWLHWFSRCLQKPQRIDRDLFGKLQAIWPCQGAWVFSSEHILQMDTVMIYKYI